MSTIKLGNDVYLDSTGIKHNDKLLSDIINNLKITNTTITGLSLGAGSTYQLTIPDNTIFIEPLLQSGGSNYSGGQFIIVGGAYCYITSTNYKNGTNNGVYLHCNSSGLIDISSYQHCGANVTGFRIWYLSK